MYEPSVPVVVRPSSLPVVSRTTTVASTSGRVGQGEGGGETFAGQASAVTLPTIRGGPPAVETRGVPVADGEQPAPTRHEQRDKAGSEPADGPIPGDLVRVADEPELHVEPPTVYLAADATTQGLQSILPTDG